MPSPEELRAHAYENPRPELHELVPRDARRILDLGCASGALGAALKRRQGAEVVGVELDPVYASRARERLDAVVEGDLDDLVSASRLDERLGHFDCLIAADVLEHLRDPWRVLREATALLAPGGRAVVSVPNVRYWETFWQLGRHGTWPRRDVGLFDRGHLRWFTLSDAHGLLGQAGLEVVAVRRSYRLTPAGSRWDRRLWWLDSVPGVRAVLAFQLHLAAKRPR